MSIAEGLKRLDREIGAMEDRHNCRRDDVGLRARDYAEIAESLDAEDRRRERAALVYLWKGDQQPDHCKHRLYGLDEYLEPYPLPRIRWLAPVMRFVRRLRVTLAIVRGRWGIRDDESGPERLRSWNAEDVCFFENDYSSYGCSVLILKFHPAQDRVAVESDGESFL